MKTERRRVSEDKKESKGMKEEDNWCNRKRGKRVRTKQEEGREGGSKRREQLKRRTKWMNGERERPTRRKRVRKTGKTVRGGPKEGPREGRKEGRVRLRGIEYHYIRGFVNGSGRGNGNGWRRKMRNGKG